MDKRQSIIRKRTDSRFTITPNEIAQSKDLSHAAKGLLLQMLSYPNDWAFNLRHLASQSASGLHATRTAFEELQTAGYVSRTLQRDDRGHLLGYEYTVTDTPTVVRFSDDGLSDNGEPHATKTELTNTDKDLKTLVEKTPEPRPPRESATPTRQIEEIIQAWNNNCGTLPKITIINQHRKRRIQNLIREHNGTAAQLITDATRNVANNPYWQENRYTFDNLLAGGKYLSHAEAHQTTQQPPTRANTEVPF
jgi:hypothetical protein